MIHCERVPAEHILAFWDDCKPFLQRALDKTYGEFTIEDILDNLLEEKEQLHILTKEDQLVGAAVTEVVDYPRRRALRIHLMGGQLLNGTLEALEDHMVLGAKAIDADHIEWIGRPGWQKVFSGSDKQTVRVTMIKEVH